MLWNWFISSPGQIWFHSNSGWGVCNYSFLSQGQVWATPFDSVQVWFGIPVSIRASILFFLPNSWWSARNQSVFGLGKIWVSGLGKSVLYCPGLVWESCFSQVHCPGFCSNSGWGVCKWSVKSPFIVRVSMILINNK